MEKSKFQFVVQTVEKMRYDYVTVTGIVEGDKISVNDYLCLTTPQGKKIKAQVIEIVVEPQLDIRTAEARRYFKETHKRFTENFHRCSSISWDFYCICGDLFDL